jgi:hypothetical protein
LLGILRKRSVVHLTHDVLTPCVLLELLNKGSRVLIFIRF